MGGLSRSVLADADASAIEGVFSKIPLLDAKVMVSASGDGSPAKPHRMTKKTPQEVVMATKEKVQSTVGWHVVGYEGKADELTAFFRETAATYNRKALQERLKKEMRHDGELLPKVRFGGAPGFPAGASALTVDIPLDSKRAWYSVPSPDGKFDDHPAGKPATGTATITVVVVPDGAHTWVAFGSDAAMLKKRLAEVKSPKADQTLQGRDGLELLKTTKASSASFATLEPAVRAAEQAMATTGSGKADEIKKMLEGLPNKGKTPLVAIGTAGGGANPSMTVELQIQKGTFEDAAALIIAAMAMKHSGGESSMPPVAVPVPAPMMAPPKAPKMPKK